MRDRLGGRSGDGCQRRSSLPLLWDLASLSAGEVSPGLAGGSRCPSQWRDRVGLSPTSGRRLVRAGSSYQPTECPSRNCRAKDQRRPRAWYLPIGGRGATMMTLLFPPGGGPPALALCKHRIGAARHGGLTRDLRVAYAVERIWRHGRLPTRAPTAASDSPKQIPMESLDFPTAGAHLVCNRPSRYLMKEEGPRWHGEHGLPRP